ncbi:MAG: hypothetical protein K9L30_18300 [Desulfobacterales bacterium]|nr:hypothetical protein [Desulfobacterales bacterium]
MLWLDSVLAVPTIAIRFETNYNATIDIQKNIIPFINKLHGEKKLQRIDQKEIWGYVIVANGFTFHIRSNNVIVKYTYAIDEIPNAGSLPSFKMPELRNYSEIMEESCDYLKEILTTFSKIDGLKYNRIGVVSEANFENDSLPPGVNNLLKYLGKPWNNNLLSLNSKSLSMLEDHEKYYDQCHHFIEFNEETILKTGYRIVLDWQRLYKEPKNFNFDNTFKEIINCKNNALVYFENFGAGDLNYD